MAQSTETVNKEEKKKESQATDKLKEEKPSSLDTETLPLSDDSPDSSQTKNEEHLAKQDSTGAELIEEKKTTSEEKKKKSQKINKLKEEKSSSLDTENLPLSDDSPDPAQTKKEKHLVEQDSTDAELIEEKKTSSEEKKKVRKPEFPPSELLIGINVAELGIDRLRPEIRDRENQRNSTFDKLKDINKERNNHKQNRDKFNQESMEYFKKVSELKTKRNDTNKEIRELKQMRESVLQELKQFSSRQKEILDKMKESSEGHNKSANPRRITKEIEQLEWKLQTTPNVTLEEDRIVMERIDVLNSTLHSAQSVASVQKELYEIRKRKGTLKTYLDDSWKQLNELVNTSQSRHQRLSELYEAGKKTKQEADQNHKLFISCVEKTSGYRKLLRKIRAELDILYPRYKKLQQEKRKTASSKRMTHDLKVRDAKTKEIKQKLSSKKGLSMEEMKFLVENKLISLKGKGSDSK